MERARIGSTEPRRGLIGPMAAAALAAPALFLLLGGQVSKREAPVEPVPVTEEPAPRVPARAAVSPAPSSLMVSRLRLPALEVQDEALRDAPAGGARWQMEGTLDEIEVRLAAAKAAAARAHRPARRGKVRPAASRPRLRLVAR